MFLFAVLKTTLIYVSSFSEEAFGLPLNKGSVTIVPTIVNAPRPRMQQPGVRGGARRGRPPMAMQYATGNIITKGQMPVRIIKKPVNVSGRGGKAFQTIAMPAASGGTTPQALLNKSVVITPASKANTSTAKAVRNIKLNPKVTVTPTTKVSAALPGFSGTGTMAGNTLPSTSGMTKVTKRTTMSQLASLHRNEKLRRASEAKKEQLKEASALMNIENAVKSSDEGMEEEEETKMENTEVCEDKEKDGKDDENVEEADTPVNLMSKKDETGDGDLGEIGEGDGSSEVGPQGGTNVGMDLSLGMSSALQQTTVSSGETHTSSGAGNQQSDPSLTGMSHTADNSDLDAKFDSSNNSADLDSSDEISANLTSDHGSPSVQSNEVVLGTPSKSAVGFGMRDLAKPLSGSISTSLESRTGIVKPQVQQTPNKPTASLTPLQSMSNLLPPDGPGPPGTPNTSHNSSSMSHLSSFSSQQAFHSSQPLFQPFLQQPQQQQQSQSQQQQQQQQQQTSSAGSSNTSSNSSWTKSTMETVSSASLGSNVAQVAPHVHQAGPSPSNTYTTTQSSFLPSTTHALYSSSGGTYGTGTMSGVGSTSTTQQSSSSTTFPTMSESSQLPQQQQQQQQQQSQQIQQSQQSSLSSSLTHTGSGLVPTSRSSGLGGADSPLSLSHLLNSQVFDSVPEDLSSPHSHASALDYLNYTLSTGTSAFRRPDYQATLSPDLQSLINSATTQQPLASALPSAAHVASNPSVTSPSPFPTYQPPTYPQYAPSYRAGTSVSASPYAAYAGQYPPYPTQYPPGLAPHAGAAAQPPTMSQYGALHTPPNPYQTYPAPPTPGRSPYSSSLGGFSHGPYPPM